MKIAIIGDYDQKRPSHIATRDCLKKSESYLSTQIETKWFPTLSLETSSIVKNLAHYHGIWGAPGDHESRLGIVNGIQFAREQNIPYLGT